MRLIDGHALMESLQKATSNAIKPDFAKGLLEAQRLTINAPTIDAVEVVRCKDCKYKYVSGNGTTHYYVCDFMDAQYEEDGFCHHGKSEAEK